MKTTLPALSAAALLLPLVAVAAEPVSTRFLLEELTDLRRLAELPDPPFTCRQFSSYDRRSTAPNQPEKPEEGWFANADFGQYLRTEQHGDRKEYVMADMEGPGALVRIWSADPKGTLRIYLDGADTPAIETPMLDFLGGRTPGFPEPIAHERSRGWNTYFPIPYAKHCKVTSDADRFYYHVNYRTYPPGTPVETYTPEQLGQLEDVIWRTAGKLGAPRLAGEPAGAVKRNALPNRPLTPQEPLHFSATGPGAIAALRVRLEAPDVVSALRHVLLTIDFDGAQTVAAPLGDFFGTVPGLSEYEALPQGVRRGELWSHWFMPYERSVELRLVNAGEPAAKVSLEVDTVPYAWTERSLHFHAKWRQARDVPTRPFIDWNYLTARGQGQFVGVSFAIANPVRQWWGEGDEKIFVDGESFPSHFGTGTEDYYGYAWCSNERFTHAFHNQPRCDGPGNYGHTINNRFHVLDRIPFTRDFRFDMELWHWHGEQKVEMAVVAYWYARPGGTDEFPPIAPRDLDLKLLPEYVVYRAPGAIEGEKMRVLEKREKTHVGPHLHEGASGDETLLFHGELAAGDKLVLGFEVQQAGTYRVQARFLKARDFGIVQWSLNGRPAGEPIDLYSQAPLLTDEGDLGTFELTAGENRLAAELVGTNEKSQGQRFRLSLDYIRLEPAE